MSKTLENVAARTGLVYSPQSSSMQGFWSGFLFYVMQNDTPEKTLWVGTWVTAENAEAGEVLARFLEDFAASSGGRAFDASWSGDAESLYGVVSITFRDPPGEEEDTQRWMENYMHRLLAFFKEQRFLTRCIECETPERVGLYMIDGEMAVCQCEACHADLCQRSKKGVQFSAGQWCQGIFGAVGGGMFGVILWVLISRAGYISAIAGYVIGVCCFRAFAHRAGGHNLRSIFVCGLLALLMCVGAELWVYFVEISEMAREAQIEFPGTGFLGRVELAIHVLLTDPATQKGVGGNLLIGLVLGGIPILTFFNSWYSAYAQGIPRETLVPPQGAGAVQSVSAVKE